MDAKRHRHPETGDGLLLTGARAEFSILHDCLVRADQHSALDFYTQLAVSRAKDATSMGIAYGMSENSFGRARQPDDVISVHFTDELAGNDAPAGRAHLLAVRMMRMAMAPAVAAGENAAAEQQTAVVRLERDLQTSEAIPPLRREPGIQHVPTVSSE